MTAADRRPAVLNTRPRGQAAELSRLLERAGFEAIEIPAIEVAPAWEPAALERTRQDLAAGVFEWVVLPSQNAGAALTDRLANARVVCGSQTARALGVRPALRLDRFSARAALDVLCPLITAGQQILVPRAAESSEDLVAGLASVGALVRAPIAYSTVPVDPARLEPAARLVRTGAVVVITVCSPSAVWSLVAGIGREALGTVALVCLGETTAEAARQAGLHVAAIAEQTSMVALVAAVVAQREVLA